MDQAETVSCRPADLHKDWDEYDTKHVVFSPVNMPPEDLLAGYRRILREVYSFDSILKKLNHYWLMDFWQQSNRLDPVKLRYRLLFAVRLSTLLVSFNLRRSQFIIRMSLLQNDHLLRSAKNLLCGVFR